MIEKIESIYSPGTAKYLEDGCFFHNLPFFGVIDGCSAPYNKENPPILFNGLTGGQMVRNVILDTFNSASHNLSLEYVAFEANKEIGRQQGIVASIPLDRADLLACASFLLAKINENSVKILQGGDCYALWVTKSDKINITKNQAYDHEVVLVKNFARLMKKFNGDRQKAWEEHISFFAEMRRKNANKLYAELNGQPEVEKCWQKIEIPLSNLGLLTCFTDGLVPFNEMANEKKLAETIIQFFNKGGFNRILDWTKDIENAKAEFSHEDHAEATGLAITFV